MTQKDGNSNDKLWGGRFSGSTDPLMDEINASIRYDKRLWPQDIRGSIAWAKAQHETGILTAKDVQQITEGLEAIATQIEAGTFLFSVEHEDIHMNIEAALTDAIGEAGKKLHTGRSRNDQVATDVHLYIKDVGKELIGHLSALINLLADMAIQYASQPMPGYTHLQRAQPVTLGYHLLAWGWCLEEDLQRLHFAVRMANRCPLGSAALAGTAYPVDRHALAHSLGFAEPTHNGMMAVGDRGFVMDILHAVHLITLHMSRVGEEIVLWNSQEFATVQLDEAWSTGSSIMPQKKNPDLAELLRAKPGRTSAAYLTLAMIQKGLPFAYNKDLQEDKEPLFDALDTCTLVLRAGTEMIRTLRFNTNRMEAAIGAGHLLATEAADYLAAKGVPFRTAHHVVGKAVAEADRLGVTLPELPLAVWQKLEPACEEDLFAALTVDAALAKRNVYGGTAPARVTEAAERLKSAVLSAKND